MDTFFFTHCARVGRIGVGFARDGMLVMSQKNIYFAFEGLHGAAVKPNFPILLKHPSKRVWGEGVSRAGGWASSPSSPFKRPPLPGRPPYPISAGGARLAAGGALGCWMLVMSQKNIYFAFEGLHGAAVKPTFPILLKHLAKSEGRGGGAGPFSPSLAF